MSLIFSLCYVADDRVCYFYLAPDFTGDFIIHYFAGRGTRKVKRRKQEKKGIRHLCYRENRLLRWRQSSTGKLTSILFPPMSDLVPVEWNLNLKNEVPHDVSQEIV